MRYSLFLVPLCVLTSLFPGHAEAAFTPSTVYVGIRANPEYPEPRDTVVLTASTDRYAGQYSYTWTVDDEVVAEGIDVSSITVIAKAAGERTVVLLSITDTAGIPRGETEYVIQPGSVDIAWEGRTYVAPFYSGKALPNKNGGLSIEAIPQMFLDGKRLNKHELVYLWEVDGVAYKAGSGYGKFSITINPARFSRGTTVSVTAQTLDGVYAAQSSVRIPTADPVFVVYERLPLSGAQLEKAIPDTFVLNKDEATFELQPFFTVNPGTLSYAWFLNDSAFNVDPAAPRRATFRREGSGGGIFNVEVQGGKSGELYNRGSAKFLLSLE